MRRVSPTVREDKTMNRLSIVLLGGVMTLLFLGPPHGEVLGQQSTAPASDAKLERMISAGKSQQELSQYLFNTHGCKNCHTMGHEGKLGYTAKGKERAKGFEGCINMLTAMTVIVQVPEDQRTPQQSQKAARFEEFGCTACHMLTPGKLDLTEVGAKLAHLHLGCVDMEKVLARGPAPRH